MVHILYSEWPRVMAIILELEGQGIVTRTFRRLDPGRQQAVVGAIFAEAAESGPASINIKQVADRAGVSVGSLYQYFNNREGLLRFATGLCVRLLVDAFDQLGPYLEKLSLREALRTYLAGGLEWGHSMQGLIQFVGKAAYQGDPEMAVSVVEPVGDAMRKTTSGILGNARQRGELRSDVDLDATASVVNALVIALGDSQMLPYLDRYYRITATGVPFERVLDALLELLERGLLRDSANGNATLPPEV